MKLALFGGTGGVGQHLVTQALDAGHAVTAYARRPDELPRAGELTVIEGSLSEREKIAEAIDGADAVLSALGARSNTPAQVEVFGAALDNITRAMQERGVRRLVSISGAGVLLPDDTVDFGRRFVRFLLSVFAKHVTAAKEREYEVIRAADVDWVLVRPPRIVEGARTGEYRVLGDRPPSSKINQGDVADLMLKCAAGDEWVRRGPIPGY